MRRLGNSPSSVATPDLPCLTHISITATAACQSDLYSARVGGRPCIIEIVILQWREEDMAKIRQLIWSFSIHEDVARKPKRAGIVP